MFQLTFHFLSGTDEEFVNTAEPKSAHETPYYALRGKRLSEALHLIEQAEEVLLEARVAAARSECKGILHRFRRLALKTESLKRCIALKTEKLKMRALHD